jgi:hypothetical protein
MPDSLIKDLTKPKGAIEQTASVKIRIGANEYLINVKRIPYFESFLSFQSKSGQLDEWSVPTHGDITLFDTIYHGLQDGYRHFFDRTTTRQPTTPYTTPSTSSPSTSSKAAHSTTSSRT